MPADWRYRGRVVTTEDILFIRQFIADRPSMSRRKLSAELCKVWQWKQANGALCDMVCRGLLLMLHRAGEIECQCLPSGGNMSRRSAGSSESGHCVMVREEKGGVREIEKLERD